MEEHLEGIRLFNSGHYWHAHEQWEHCWLRSTEPERTFYKGIIQAAAALVHWQRGNPRGVYLNWVKSRPKLVALPAHMHQIHLAQLISEMDAFVLGQSENPPQLSVVE
jgi:predicted metal-dependent hydrolase